MSSKVQLNIIIPIGLLVLVFLAVQGLSRISALTPARGNTIDARSLAGSDWIERHPVALKLNFYAGSDWIERHSPSLSSKSLAGSDWVERHPPVVSKAGFYAGSDLVERHPSIYYTGSDWIERHSGQPTQ